MDRNYGNAQPHNLKMGLVSSIQLDLASQREERDWESNWSKFIKRGNIMVCQQVSLISAEAADPRA